MSDKEIKEFCAILTSLPSDYQHVIVALLRECAELSLQDADNHRQGNQTV